MSIGSKIKKQFEVLEPKLQPLLDSVVEKLDTIFPDCIVEGSVKTIESVVRKENTKKYDDILEFSDLIRGRFFFPDKYNYEQIISKIVDKLHDHIDKIEWQKSKDFGLKYKGIVHIDFDFNGIKFELQVIPLGFRKFIDPLHKVYELLRDGANISDEEKKRLIALHNKIYDIFEKHYL